ncbi:hypothetical protein P20652_3748 [Pseudoalteromonas sp. BSi20652]|nr:hypothetical protein [Pseudoalteromonas sp. BSi20652]GAA61859.1 hypothetical protein P20652_3748 [Pseudoalteromonas sp. BSi20652]
MINKQLIKKTMPGVFNFVKNQPQLFKLAQQVDAKLQQREYVKLNNE